MSVIVWDGQVLVTDRAVNDGTNRWVLPKMWKVRDGVLAAIGPTFDVNRFLGWYNSDGPTAEKFPTYNGRVNAVLVREKSLFRFDHLGNQVEHGTNKLALGEGRDFAYGALALGHTAIEAVKAANMYSIVCGLGFHAYDAQTDQWHEGE
jgi:hypothetical protein